MENSQLTNSRQDEGEDYNAEGEANRSEDRNFSENDEDVGEFEGEENPDFDEEGEDMGEGEDDQEGEDGQEGEGEDGQEGESGEHSENFTEENFSMKDHSKRGSQFDMNQRSMIDTEADATLAPERKIRNKLFRFINRLREGYLLPDFVQDNLGNKLAMDYAQHLLREKESESLLQEMALKVHFPGAFKLSHFSVFNDLSDDNGAKKSKYSDYTSEFVDAHSTLVEFEADRSNLLSSAFNTVSMGVAYDDEKVVIVDLFSSRELTVESCSINEDMGSIIVKGRMLNDSFGVYAMRVVSEDSMGKSLMLLNPSHMISPEQKHRPFTASFIGAQNLIKDKSCKFVEVYIREKPSTIRYNLPFPDNMSKFESDLKHLRLALRFELESFPLDIVLREQRKEEQDEKERLSEEEHRKADEKLREKEEKDNRIKKIDNNNLGINKNFYKIGEVAEELEDDNDMNRSMNSGGNNESVGKTNKSSEEGSLISETPSEDVNRKENYQRQLEKLEQNIEELKKENEELQRKIRIIYDFKRKEGRDERNYYKESNINESTYADSLTSAANLHNELNTHKRKLMADLEKYNQSIEIQDERKREVYKILMNYKEELLSNAEYRKGSKIPREQVDRWLDKERDAEEEIRKLRIENIKNTLELNRLNKELKKMEEYFEGLHLIDFEQLKIENNTLTEKIEDRNEEIHKLKIKINSNVQVLAHLQEKYSYVNKDHKHMKSHLDTKKEVLMEKKDAHSDSKADNETNTLSILQKKVKIDQINSSSLKKYYSATNNNIDELSSKIEMAISQLTRFRKDNVKDVKLLETRKKKLIDDYKSLPKFKDQDVI